VVWVLGFRNRQLESYMIEQVYIDEKWTSFPSWNSHKSYQVGEENTSFTMPGHYCTQGSRKISARERTQVPHNRAKCTSDNIHLDNNGVFLLSEGQALAKIRSRSRASCLESQLLSFIRTTRKCLKRLKIAWRRVDSYCQRVKGVVFDVVYSPYLISLANDLGSWGSRINVTGT